MQRREVRELIRGTSAAALVIGAFVVWALADNTSLYAWTREDRMIESATAVLFGLASVGFALVAARSDFLKEKQNRPRYVMTVCWALLMFVFMGEEISWGQRLFGFETPEGLARINKQNEVNLHNIVVVDTLLGGKYRYLSMMMLTTGLFLPLFAATRFGKRVIQWWGFPVCPAAYWLVFVGAYVYGKTVRQFMVHTNDASEVREFLMAVGMFCFAWHGAIRPCAVFRACDGARSAP